MNVWFWGVATGHGSRATGAADTGGPSFGTWPRATAAGRPGRTGNDSCTNCQSTFGRWNVAKAQEAQNAQGALKTSMGASAFRLGAASPRFGLERVDGFHHSAVNVWALERGQGPRRQEAQGGPGSPKTPERADWFHHFAVNVWA